MNVALPFVAAELNAARLWKLWSLGSFMLGPATCGESDLRYERIEYSYESCG